MSVSHVSQDEPTRADVWTVLKELPQRVEALLKHHVPPPFRKCLWMAGVKMSSSSMASSSDLH